MMRKLDQVNCAKLKYLNYEFGGKFLLEIFGGNAIFDILEPPTFQKYIRHRVLEALCICLCLCLCVFVFVFL